MTLDLYFARRFTLSFLMIGAVFLTLMMLIDMIEHLRKFEGIDISFGQILRLMFLNVPGAISEILPLMMILATVLLFVSLARTSELVVTRAVGRSALRALMAPVGVAMIIGMLAVSTLNPIVAATAKRYQQLSDTYRFGSAATASVSADGLWLRQGDENGQQTVIYASGYDVTTDIVQNIMLLRFDSSGAPVDRINAQSAQLQNGEWTLTNAKRWTLNGPQNPESNARVMDQMTLPSSLDQEQVRDSLGRETEISIWDLPEIITDLQRAGFSSRRHEVWFQVELARPLFLVAMVLIASAFTMRHVRFGGTGMAVLFSVLLGFGLYFIRNFAQILGENGQIAIALAAWAPPIASIMLALGLLLHAEDG